MGIKSKCGIEAIKEHRRRCGIFKRYCKILEGVEENKTIIPEKAADKARGAFTEMW